MTTPNNVPGPGDGGAGDRALPCIARCPDPDCPAPAEVCAEVALDSTDGPVRHARTFCLSRHFYQLPVEYIPGMTPLGTDRLVC
jgi:hypothetical protein